MGLYEILKPFLANEEGFSEKPYWDVRQWTWGYGTKVPDSSDLKAIEPVGTITKTQALIELVKHTDKDKEKLQKRITVKLNNNQWAALLSFSYNLGIGNAYNLITNINLQRWDILKEQWKKYHIADGRVNETLKKRRDRELNLFFKT